MVNAPARQPPVAARRVGYVIAAALTAVFWYLVNVRPGWEALAFLTDDAERVIPLLDVSLAASLVANVLYLAYDAPWFKAVGDIATTSIGIAVLVRVWQVFPFTFTGSFDWSLAVRVTVMMAIVGSIIAIAVNVVALVRGAAHAGGAGMAGRRAQ